jgi:hypothetical protein
VSTGAGSDEDREGERARTWRAFSLTSCGFVKDIIPLFMGRIGW